ncbi:MAG: D-lysine 5,6-aminomutase subunit alpha [Myxococcales bacterium]|nr:D-lysine 5,6-aminomutase subunit alpha [Myxococcales bacterium]
MPDSPVISTFAPTAAGFGCPALSLDAAVVHNCRQLAAKIASEVTAFSEAHSTVAIERTVLRLCGITGATAAGVPLVNVVVAALEQVGELGNGIALPFFSAAVALDLTPQQLADVLADDASALSTDPLALHAAVQIRADTADRARALAHQYAQTGIDQIVAQRAARKQFLRDLGEGNQPLCYVIVATGNIFEDVVQARVAARQGADVIAVIRSTGQSLLDYVPEGTTTEGYGGTYATQANFALMRAALDEVGAELGRYIRLCNYASGLCMPEIACLGGLERLDMMLNDALYGILFRDINMQRTLCDQRVSRRLSALAGLIINTGEDNYLTTADAVDAAHTVVASTLINEALGRACSLQTEQLGLGHAMEIDPLRPNMLLYEIAHAALIRALFPGAPLKYMPPTKHMTGNVLRGHVQDALFNLVTVLTGQGICLLGMPTEAMHTPHVHDRYWALESAQLIFGGAAALGSELQFRPGGVIEQRCKQVLEKAYELLQNLATTGLMDGLSRGLFADIKRSRDGGRGLDGVFARGPAYWDPTGEIIDKQLQLISQQEAG